MSAETFLPFLCFVKAQASRERPLRLFSLALAAAFVCAGARAQIRQPGWTDEMFEQWVFQQDRNAAGARQRLESLLALRIDEVDRACQLTDAQKKKLQLAGQGDMRRFFARYETVKKKFKLMGNDQNKINQIWQDINPLQTSLQAGLFHEDSLLVKALPHTLTAEQCERYDPVVRERRAFRHRAAIEVTVALLEQNMPLRASQRSDLIALLTKQTKPARKSGQYESYVMMVQLSRVPEEKVKPLFDAMQWQVVKHQLDQTKRMEPFLRQSGEWPDGDKEADKADARPAALPVRKSAPDPIEVLATWALSLQTVRPGDYFSRPSSVLRLTDGSFLPGELRGSEDPNVLSWRSPFFAQPLKFPLRAIHSVQYAVAGAQPEPRGQYCFELLGDDVLYGKLLRLTENDLELDAARAGRVHVRREHVRRFYRWKGGDSLYLGPNGLHGSKEFTATPGWREEGGQLVTEQAGASLYGNLGIPEKAVIEIELSWRAKPDFDLVLGADQPDAFHLEVWDRGLVAVGESAQDADVAFLHDVGAGEGRLRIQAYLDQTQKRLILLSRSGKPLATLTIHPKKGRFGSGLRLTNGEGDVRLEHLRITRWNGRDPREVREGRSRLHRTDGSIVYGRVTAYDPQAKQFTLRDGMTETVVKEDAAADVFLSPQELGNGSTAAAEPMPQRTVRLIYRDGSCFSGTLRRLEDTRLTLVCPGIKEHLSLPLADLRSLISLRVGERSPALAVAGKRGRLEMEGVSLRGWLVNGKGPSDASCLVWHPDLGLNASPLLPGLSGRIVYRARQPAAPSLPPAGAGPYQAVAPAGVRAEARVKGAIVQRRANERVREQLWRMVPVKDSSGYLKLVHVQSGKVLAIAGKSNESGELAVLARDDGSTGQQWKFEKDGAYFRIVNRKSGKVLDVQGGSMEEDAPIIQWDSKPDFNDNQRWSWQGNGNVRRLRSKASGLVLDVGGEAAVIQRRVGLSPLAVQRPSGGRPALHLRSGDTIPCEVTHIDEKGVTLKTPLSEATFVPHEKIKSMELIAGDSPKLDETKRDRLLTLPRMQKDSPPTHLIFSENGDFLRGRILEMDEKSLKVEVRLETREIPRDRIAQIVWLHADEWTGPKTAPAAAVSPPNRVQILREDGNRLTFLAQKVDAQTISGTSDVLGACRADLDEVDQVLLGTSIEESAAKLADHSWKLHPAAEPKFAQADADSSADGRPNGIESPLVGQPAFSFRLDTLAGRPFDLANHKGRVVVVDFWATWCGPCMQSMPLVESVVQELADRGVDLIAVNLEEDPEHVKSVAERHKLKVPVAFDRDSAVAAKYAVTAIPQTVVIDRDGKIARVFVGGGKKTADALRKALQELSAAKPAAAP